jgi:hypothetical protein
MLTYVDYRCGLCVTRAVVTVPGALIACAYAWRQALATVKQSADWQPAFIPGNPDGVDVRCLCAFHPLALVA